MSLGSLPLADVGKVVEDLLFHGDLAGLEELLVRPLVLAGHHVMAGIFARPAIPIAAHADELSGDLKAAICYIVMDWQKWATSSAGRALRSQCRGRGFDPPVVHQINQFHTKNQSHAKARSAPKRLFLLRCGRRHLSQVRCRHAQCDSEQWFRTGQSRGDWGKMVALGRLGDPESRWHAAARLRSGPRGRASPAVPSNDRGNGS